MSTDVRGLERIQPKTEVLCPYRSFTHDHVNYKDLLETSHLHTLHNR